MKEKEETKQTKSNANREICNQQPFEIKTKLLNSNGFLWEKKTKQTWVKLRFCFDPNLHWRVNSTYGQRANKREEAAAAISSERAQFTLLRIERTRQRRWFFCFFFFWEVVPGIWENTRGKINFFIVLGYIYANWPDR